MTAPPWSTSSRSSGATAGPARVSAALVVVVLAVSGIPLSVLISPILVAAAAVPVYLADLVFDVPEVVTGWLDRVFNLLPTMWSAVRRSDVDMPWDWLVGLFVFPGLVAIVLLWAVVRLTFRRTGVGGVLRRMKARPPRSGDLAEQRLANLVQEVAVAAAVPPPRVLLIDTKAANVGAAGLTMDDATVVVTRGFVDRLPRDAQQAVIAHVMASIGNGDLTLAAEILTLIQVWGLVSLMLEAPLVPRRAGQPEAGGPDRPGHASGSGRRAESGAGGRHPAGGRHLREPGLRRVRAAAGRRTRWCSCSATCRSWSRSAPPPSRPRPSSGSRVFVMAPFVSVLWRTRRKLADATAVQLTRYPGALADAYRTLAGLDMKVPGAVEVHFLFPVWDPAVDRDQTRTDVTSAAAAHAAPARAAAPAAGAPRRERGWCAAGDADPGLTWREVAAGAGWIGVGAVLLGRRGGAECGGRGGGAVRARMAAAQGAGGVPAVGRGAVELMEMERLGPFPNRRRPPL